MIRELPSPLMFAFIGEQAGFGASHLSDSSRVSVAKQPNHLPFALGRICFRPWSKAFSTLVKSLFDTCQKAFSTLVKSLFDTCQKPFRHLSKSLFD